MTSRSSLSVRDSNLPRPILVRQKGKADLLNDQSAKVSFSAPSILSNVSLKNNSDSLFAIYEDPDEDNVIRKIEKQIEQTEVLPRNNISVNPMGIVTTNFLDPCEELSEGTISTVVASSSALTSQHSHHTSSELPEHSDLSDNDDISVPNDFIEDTYLYMRSREVTVRAKPSYMSRQTEINEEMRSILIGWLNEVCDEYAMCQETLHIAVSLVDRTLSKFKIDRNKLQLVGTAAMMIASKLEEVTPPELKNYVYITDDTFTAEQIVQMERAILNELKGDIAAPTTRWFCGIFMKMAKCDNLTRDAAEYILNLGLMNTGFLAYRPSCVAAACFSLANLLAGNVDYWSKNLEKKTGIRASSLRDVLRLLHSAFCDAPRSSHSSLFNKYSTYDKNEVALLSPPDIECYLLP